jgi:hypothetical protein
MLTLIPAKAGIQIIFCRHSRASWNPEPALV